MSRQEDDEVLRTYVGEMKQIDDMIPPASDGAIISERVKRLIEEHNLLFEALSSLVALKNGPRDEVYEREKPLAWKRAREVIAEVKERKRQHGGTA